jgi:hypothetical protein
VVNNITLETLNRDLTEVGEEGEGNEEEIFCEESL